ncbi:hypothetical protein CsatB_024399 [Cannabis sativa]
MLSPEKSLPEGQLQKPVNSMDELFAKTDKLTVIDDDGWEINEDGGSELGKFCAMGRLCSNQTMNRSLLKTILGRMVAAETGDPTHGFGPWLKVEDKKDSMNIFGKGKIGINSVNGSVNPGSGLSGTSTFLNKPGGAGSGSVSNSGIPSQSIPAMSPRDVGVDTGLMSSLKVDVSCADGMERVAEKTLDKMDVSLISPDRMVNLKRKGVWLDD